MPAGKDDAVDERRGIRHPRDVFDHLHVLDVGARQRVVRSGDGEHDVGVGAAALSVICVSRTDASPCLERAEVAWRALPDGARERSRIDDQDNFAVAEVGGAGNAFNPHERVRNRPHHDFALADDPVDGNADHAAARRDDKDVKSRRRLAADAEETRQPDDGERARRDTG